MKKEITLKSLKWVRWVLLPAFFAAVFLYATPAYAQEPSPIDELTRGLNTLWILLTAFLVFWMQAGFALVEAGLTRAKNTTNILFKNLMDFVFATLAFWAFGYAFMYGSSAGGWIGTSGYFIDASFDDVVGVPVLAFWFFQLVFAGTAATIVSGAMAERTKFSAYLIYSFFITAIIYPIAGHWVWGGGWLWTLPFGDGFRDFAGSTVVHSVGGWLALIGAIVLGPRLGRFTKDGKAIAIPGHSITLVTLGVFILWLGWFGFNPGSQLAIHGGNADAVALVATNTTLAAAAGAISAMLITWLFVTKKPDLATTLNGALAGLVAITAPCAYVTPGYSLLIGAIGGVIVVYGAILLERLKIDDPVGAVPVHLFNGIWGTLSIGIFGTVGIGSLVTGDTGQIVAQFIGVLAFGVWCTVTGSALFLGIKATNGLRVSREEEIKGLDIEEHGSQAYPEDAVAGALSGAD
ncbi:MAG: ammonium transporter [Anaerolineales bacterium]|nr:ammonium transporter [Anaerolineales bacterium]MBX3035889.1 ammonium transporter [Anaerolineales bacterium]